MSSFEVTEESIPLPLGAFAKARRVLVRWRGRWITALNQGPFRAYLYPLYTPAGVAVTTDGPIDHPHHQSVWIGADHVYCRLPYADDAFEDATYNFYVGETFQGRAPGRILSVGMESTELADDHLRITQTLEWQGPEEWGARPRRTIAIETRMLDIITGQDAHYLDIHSHLRPTEWDFSIGPTRHAYLGVRFAEGLRVIDGGTVLDADGRTGSEAINDQCSDWVAVAGTVPSGRRAGVAVFPYPSAAGHPWHVSEYGTLNVNPFARERVAINRGDELEVAARLVVYDGDATEARIAERFESFRQEGAAPYGPPAAAGGRLGMGPRRV